MTDTDKDTTTPTDPEVPLTDDKRLVWVTVDDDLTQREADEMADAVRDHLSDRYQIVVSTDSMQMTSTTELRAIADRLDREP